MNLFEIFPIPFPIPVCPLSQSPHLPLIEGRLAQVLPARPAGVLQGAGGGGGEGLRAQCAHHSHTGGSHSLCTVGFQGDGDVAGDAPQAREQQAEQEGQAKRLESAEKGICFIEIFKTLFNQFYSLEAVVERSKHWKDSSTT